MKPFFSVAFVVTTVTISAISPARAQEANPILLELRPQLQKAMEKVAPDATWELKGNELTASYKTRDFTNSLENVAAQPQPEIGPTSGGFILRLRVFSQLPYFATEIPKQIRQAHWKTFTTRMNLRTSENKKFDAPEPEITQIEQEHDPNDRQEFLIVPREMETKYSRLAGAGLFKIETYGTFRSRPLMRYNAAVTIARLQNAIPDLTENKDRRIKALQAATAGRKLSPAEIESLDSDIRDLQIELDGELQKLGYHGSFLGDRNSTIKPRIEAAKKPAYLVFTLQTPLTNDTLSPQPFTQIIEDTVREHNRRADEK